MNFKKLYDALADKAKSRNENFTFMEGDPRKFGHGAPDPDWTLMTIRESIKHGITRSSVHLHGFRKLRKNNRVQNKGSQ